MSFALNEVEATAKKSARGAGYSWGMAEEAAKATRWLVASGVDGCKALVSVLNATDGSDLAKMAPTELSGNWHGEAGCLCPLMAGATLADTAGMWPAGAVMMEEVIAPVLLLPFAALAARQLGATVTVEWDGVMATTDGQRLCLNAVKTETAASVTIRVGGQMCGAIPQQCRAAPDNIDWTTLNQFAQRTYAPSTEESRLKGAGAGLVDND